VHDVAASKRALVMTDAIIKAGRGGRNNG
jgi:hypothetical protein